MLGFSIFKCFNYRDLGIFQYFNALITGMVGCWDVGMMGSWDLGQVLGQVDIFAGASPSGHFRRCNWSTGNDLDT